MLILFITNFFSHQGITNLSLLGCFFLKLSDCHLPKRNCFICFNEGPFKMINNSFNFMVKALFILKIFKFLSSVFGQVEKRLDKKGKANFKIYDIMTLLTNHCNAYCPRSNKVKAFRK